MQVRHLLIQATQDLSDSPTPRLDAEVLLMHVLTVSRSYFYTNPERVLTTAELAAFNALLTRRQHGEPIAYITGQREFWSLDLLVTPATLIPRPETELLVEQALAKIPLNTALTIADLGTGSGAIALAIAKERPQVHVYAIDKSLAALEVAQLNAKRLNITNVSFVCSDWLLAFPPLGFDMIVSNPPYIAADDSHLTQGDVRFEPITALVAQQNGLAAYQAIIQQAQIALQPNGWILFEHGYNQQSQLTDLLVKADFKEINCTYDLAELPRVTCAQLVSM